MASSEERIRLVFPAIPGFYNEMVEWKGAFKHLSWLTDSDNKFRQRKGTSLEKSSLLKTCWKQKK